MPSTLRRTAPYLMLWVILLTSHAAFTQQIPYSLAENKGQWPEKVAFGVDIPHGKLFVTDRGLTYHLFDLSAIGHAHNEGTIHGPNDVRIKGHVFEMQMVGSKASAFFSASQKQPSYFNYFLGSDSAQWAGGCRVYNEVIQHDVYEGIDRKLYKTDYGLKYDFIVQPGAAASQIALAYHYVDQLELVNGYLRIKTSVGEVVEEKPFAYQIIQGQKVEVPCDFEKRGKYIGFVFPEGYNEQWPLVIDPLLIFSTYSGSTSDNFGYTATYDSQGYLYSGSSAFGQGYPTTVGAYQTVWGGGDGSFGLPGTDMAITKYDVSGTFIVWSSFLGGENDDLPHSLICNEFDEVLVYGTTSSPNFPVTAGAYDTVFNGGISFSPSGVGTDYVNGSDIIVARFNSVGSDLIASTFLGGSGNDGVNTASVLKFNYADEFRGEIDINHAGEVIIATSTFSTNFPMVNPIQSSIGGAQDACLVELSADLSDIIWSTYLGGTNDDSGYSVAFDSNDNIFFCGGTKSQNFPVTTGAYNELSNGGSAEGWIARISNDGSTLQRSTYFGSSAYDQLYFVDTDDQNIPHVYGQTLAPNSTFVINAAWSEPNSGMIVAKLNYELDDVIWSTVFGSGDGEPNLSPTAFLVDVCGKIYLSGWGGSTNTSSNAQTDDVNGMTVTSDAYQSTTNASDFYLLVLEADASDIVYGSYFGGGISAEHVDGGTSRFDRKGVIYQSVCAGCGSNDDFPIFPSNAHSSTNNSNNCNNGVFKFDFELPLTVADFIVPPVACVNQPISFINTSSWGQTYAWDFGDESTSNVFSPTHLYTETGLFEITLIVTHPGTCNGADTLVRTIQITNNVIATLDDALVCSNEPTSIGPEEVNPNYEYTWVPSLFLSDPNDANPVFTPGVDSDYAIYVEHGGCVDTLYLFVDVVDLALDPIDDQILCEGEPLTLTATGTLAGAEITWSDQPDYTPVLNDNINDTDIIVDVEEPTTFYVQAVIGECVVEESVLIEPISFQTEIGGDFSVCAGDETTLTVLNPNPTFEYSWEPNQYILAGQNTTSVDVLINQETEFFVFAEAPNGCVAVDSITVMVSPLGQLTASATATPATVVQGQSTVLNALPNGYSYEWSPATGLNNPNIQNPTATPIETTTYTVTISDGECTAEASVTVRTVEFVCGPPSIYVPNAFTPNADNTNELVQVRGNNITRLYFAIYDRWGELMFETTSLNVGWDGYYKGRAVDPAVYVYYLEADCEGGESYFEEGNISVIR